MKKNILIFLLTLVTIFVVSCGDTKNSSVDKVITLKNEIIDTTTTKLIKDICSSSSSAKPDNLVSVNGVFYFTAYDDMYGSELWKSDCTTDGTVMVKDIRSGISGSNPFALTNIKGTLYFIADDGVNGKKLYKSDGTQEGTVVVNDFHNSFNSSTFTSIDDTKTYNTDTTI